MLIIRQDSLRFVYRVAGVAQHQDRVLLHRSEHDHFWSLPGGRGEMLEPSLETLRREMSEETGLAVTVDRLLWVVENFFDHTGKTYHELGLYFLMSFPPDSPVWSKGDTFLGQEVFPDGRRLSLHFQWFPLASLETLTVYPSFLPAGLRQLPPTVEHIIHNGRGA
jgi:8-oxo-dGTP pyrophosphatase MutT (NUDIX family)